MGSLATAYYIHYSYLSTSSIINKEVKGFGQLQDATNKRKT